MIRAELGGDRGVHNLGLVLRLKGLLKFEASHLFHYGRALQRTDFVAPLGGHIIPQRCLCTSKAGEHPFDRIRGHG